MNSFHLPLQTQFAEVRLRTRNLDAALHFYVDMLGLRVIERTSFSALLSPSGKPPVMISLVYDQDSAGSISYKLAVPCAEVLYAIEQRAPIFGYKSTRVSSSSNLLQLIDPQGSLLEIEVAEGIKRPRLDHDSEQRKFAESENARSSTTKLRL